MENATTGTLRVPTTHPIEPRLSELEAMRGEDTAHLACVLRSAAGWLSLAADEIDAGNLSKAAGYAKLGGFGAERMPARITDLEERIARLERHEQELAAAEVTR